MRILLLACAVLTVTPSVASAQVTYVEVSDEEMRAMKEDEKVTDEAYIAIDLLELERAKDPEFRKFRVAQARFTYERVVNARDNPQVYTREPERSETLQQFANLELSDTEYGKLLDLLAESEVQSWIHLLKNAELRATERDGITPARRAAGREWLRESAEIGTRREESIAALLGPGRYELWQKYLKNRKRSFATVLMPSRDYADVVLHEVEIQRILADAHQPLTIPQVMPLVKALMGGVLRERVKSGRREDVDQTAFTPDAWKRITEFRKGIIDDIAPHLNKLQLAALTAEFERQTATSR